MCNDPERARATAVRVIADVPLKKIAADEITCYVSIRGSLVRK